MEKFLLTLLVNEVEQGWSLSEFWNDIVEFFTGSGFWVEIARFAFVILICFSVVAFLVSGSFYKIVKDEMDKGGEEYGEIASTKVASKAVLYRVLSIILMVAVIIGVFLVIALMQ